MKKKFLFLILTLLAIVAASPHANAWVLSDFTKIVGWDIARPSTPTTNLAWNSLSLTNGSVEFVALGSDAYISLVTSDGKAVGNHNSEVKVDETTGTFWENKANYSVGSDPGDYYKLHLSGMTKGSTYTFTIDIKDNNPYVKSFKLKSTSTTLTVSKVEVFNRMTDSNKYSASFTKQADGSWVLAGGFTPKDCASKEHNTWWTSMHRIRVTLSDNSSKEYTASNGINDDTFWVTNDSYDMGVAVTGYFHIPESKVGKTVTLTFTGTTLSKMTFENAVSSKTYTATVNATNRTDITAMTMTVTGATPAVTNKPMTQSGNNWTCTFQSTTAPTKVTYSWTGSSNGSKEATWAANSISNSTTLEALPVETLTQMYVMSEALGWGTSGKKMTTNASAQTATYTTTVEIPANTRWKVASGDYDINLNNKGRYAFKYSDGSDFDCTIIDDDAIKVSKPLPVGTVIEYSYTTKNATVTVPNPVAVTIAKVEIYNSNNSDTKTFANNNGSWTLAGFVPESWANNSDGKSKYRIRVILSDGTSKIYTAVDAQDVNYWLTASKSYDMKIASTGWFLFDKLEGKDKVNLSLSFTGNTLSKIALEYVASTSTVNMPLKPSDFANGRKHYFLVGFRTAGWRLQPEWELLQVDNNHYALPANQRLMYNQYFGIAKVDTYDDYIHQRYIMYYNPQYMVKTDAPGTISLSTYRNNNGYDFPDKETNTKSNCMLWSRGLNVGTPNQDIMDENTIRWSYPSVLKKFQISVNASGAPTTLDIESTQDPAEVVKHRAFTLVGGEIRSNVNYNINGKNTTIGQANYTTEKLTHVPGWQNPWVQYDADGKPYIDANGHAVFHTAYDADYLPKHPSQFDYTLDDGTQFSYNSNRITFVEVSTMSDDELAKDEFADLYKMFDAKSHDFSTCKETHNNGDFMYTEKWNAPGNDYPQFDGKNVTTNSSYSHSDWKCFVVKDMWVRGSFKIWSGWGGNLKHGEGDGVGYENGQPNDNIRNSARWFPANGGHGTLKTNKAVKGGHVRGDNATCDVYGCRMDVEAADFNIESTDANDTKLRYYKRVILWYPGGECGFNSAVLQLIVDEGGPAIQARRADKSHLSYRWNIPEGASTEDVVDSYTILRRNTETGQTVTVKAETGISLDPGTRVEYTPWTDETAEVQPGEYEYEITIHYKASGLSKSAISNPVQIFADAQPVSLKAEQYMDGDLYSFDLVLTPVLSEKELNREANSKTGLSMAKKIRIWSDDEYTKQAMAAMRGDVLPNGWDKLDDGYYYTITDADKTDLTIEPITLLDIAPNAGLNGVDDNVYSFKVQLTCTDGDQADWESLQYVEAQASASIYAPTVDIHLAQPTIAMIGTVEERDVIARKFDAEGAYKSLPYGSYHSDGRIENPALYTLFNEIRAKATIDPLKVTSSVRENWTINYCLTVNNNDKVTLENGTPTDITIHGLSANTAAATISVDASAKVAVTYTRGDGKYEAIVMPGSSQNFKHTFPEPVFTPGEKTWFQRNYAEPNNASPQNNRALAFAQFDGTVTGIEPNLNYYVGFNFTDDAVAGILDGLKELRSTGTSEGDYKDQLLYWSVINDMAAQGGRVIGRRSSGAGATTGKLVGELPFDYLYYNHVDNTAYLNEWTVANNSWTEAFKAGNNRLPLEVGPIAVGEYGTDISLTEATINGKVDIVYPIYEDLAVTDETPASAQLRAGAAQEPEALYAPATIDIANIKAIPTSDSATLIALDASNKVTGIEQISADSLGSDAEIYNLQGIRIYNPAPGNTYIVRRGATVSKVLYK